MLLTNWSATSTRVNNLEQLVQIPAPGVAKYQLMQKQTAQPGKLSVINVKRKVTLKLSVGQKHL